MAMSNTGTDKLPQYKIEAFAAPLLLVGDEQEGMRAQFIKIASQESPTQTFRLVDLLAQGKYCLDKEAAHKMAQATRWLAVLKRDYGEEAFQNLIGEA